MNVSEVFYRLLQKRELPVTDPEVQQLLNSPEKQNEFDALAAAFDCRIAWARTHIYLVPGAENNFLGCSKADLKKRLLRYDQNVAFYYLYMFIILTLLDEFYGTSYGEGKTRSYILTGNLMNRVHENLRNGAERQNKPAQVPYERMLEQYEALKGELDKKEKNSRAQLFDTVLRFLEEQGLILRLEEDDSIRATQRLDDLADFVLRSSDGYDAMMEILGGMEDA